MLAIGRQVAIALGTLCGVLALYAYGVRFERRAIAGLSLLGDRCWGIAWPLADAWRVLTKQSLLPAESHRLVCRIAPLVTCALALAGLLCIPLGSEAQDLIRLGPLWIPWPRSGLPWVLVLSLSALAGPAFFGWAIRRDQVAQHSVRVLVWGTGYQIPIWLATAGVVLLAGSLDMGQIVEAQTHSLPYLVYQPLGALALGLSLCAGGRRLPFAVGPLSESALGDYHLQHAGWVYGFFHLGEYACLLLGSALLATLYLSGWWAPWYPGFHWVAIKTVAVAGILLWARHRWLGKREAQLRDLAWPGVALLSLGNLILTVALMLWRGG